MIRYTEEERQKTIHRLENDVIPFEAMAAEIKRAQTRAMNATSAGLLRMLRSGTGSRGELTPIETEAMMDEAQRRIRNVRGEDKSQESEDNG